MKKLIVFFLGIMVFVGAKSQQRPVIYQMMVRLFGNTNTNNGYYGSIDQNGVGKFNDISDVALDSLKTLGLTHIWYTGVIAHASMTDYSSYGINPDDPDVVKGRAGSPYAIRDYYDVDPDLAVDVKKRMIEFENLIARTHQHGLKVVMDFVPNHVARTYHSNTKPESIIDFGAHDDTSKSFSNQNDFYYLPNTSFIVPNSTDAGGSHFHSPLKDGKFHEVPAKATGNDVFKPNPSIDDWYETIKLNYGLTGSGLHEKVFSPIPSVWNKILDILLYWSAKGVDGFRCDMAEMVPVEFWSWAISQVKRKYPNIIFIAEAYNPKVYNTYISQGKFDYLYDKVGMYDAIKKMIRVENTADVSAIDSIEKSFRSTSLIRFLENHDEERIASKQFANDPKLAIPGMVVMATLAKNPVMLYFGQEVGEKGEGKEGFGGEDGSTTLFDYWGVPAHQLWMNKGKFDGADLDSSQIKLRDFYKNLLNCVNENSTIRNGDYIPLNIPSLSKLQKVYLRVTSKEFVIVAVNFDRSDSINQYIYLPKSIIRKYKLNASMKGFSILQDQKIQTIKIGQRIHLDVKPSDAIVWSFK